MKVTTKELYQWDLDCQATITLNEGEAIDEINFFNPLGDVAYVVAPRMEDGVVLVDIPNILLQYKTEIHMYTVKEDRTIAEYVFRVIPRQKPADYVYTETEVLSYKALENRVKALEEGGADVDEETITQAVKGYFAENPVQPDWNQNDETAPDFIKNRIGGYYGFVTQEVFNNEELDFSESGITSANPIVTGYDKVSKDFKIDIIFDGVEYSGTYKYSPSKRFFYFGNYTLRDEKVWSDYQMQDTGEPFVIISSTQEAARAFIYVKELGKHTVDLKISKPGLIKIPAEFLEVPKYDDTGLRNEILIMDSKISNLSEEIENLNKTVSGLDVPSDEHINELITNALGVIENGSY